jgi:hypothetical protein
MSARSRTSAAGGVGGFAVAAWMAGRMVQGYSHRNEPISGLAASGVRSTPVMVAGFVSLAGTTAGLASSVRGTAKAPAPVPALLVGAAASTLGAGLARCSARSCPTRFTGDDDATMRDELHGAFSMTTFVLWVAAPIVAARRAGSASRLFRRASGALGFTTLTTLVAGGVLARRHAVTGVGTAQRAMVASALWLLLVAW